jgi:hypothetical protein
VFIAEQLEGETKLAQKPPNHSRFETGCKRAVSSVGMCVCMYVCLGSSRAVPRRKVISLLVETNLDVSSVSHLAGIQDFNSLSASSQYVLILNVSSSLCVVFCLNDKN